MLQSRGMSVGNIVNKATLELSTTQSVLPVPAKIAFLAFHKLHRIWRWIRLGNIYSDPNNFAHLAAGHGLNYVIGDSALVRISAISVLIATRILHTVREYEKLQDSWLRMKDAFQCHYETPVRYNWDQKSGFFSLSTVIWFKTTTKSVILRIQVVAIAIFKVGKHFFLLSLRLVDAIEAFSLKPEIREEGINLMFVNTSTCMSHLVNNKDFLLESLESNQKVIEKVLEGLGSQLTVETLIDTVESALEKAGSFHRSVNTVNEHIGEFVSACGKKWTYELLREVGLRHLVPATLLPPSTPPWEHPQRRMPKKRFPPNGWLKQPEQKPQRKQKAQSSLMQSVRSFLPSGTDRTAKGVWK